ncbi:hypothetical protein D8B45_05170 [Candidatus Gracilibacteria bacterium]|nr:MAG: hypothetical protein D8B45_05170 [Candidatus Gracilibacteria bacterium]
MSDGLTLAPPESKVVSDGLKILVTSPKHGFFVGRGREKGEKIQILRFFGLFWEEGEAEKAWISLG